MKKGDRVKLRGREPQGTVKSMNKKDMWIVVDWDKGKEGPKYVHQFELETLNE